LLCELVEFLQVAVAPKGRRATVVGPALRGEFRCTDRWRWMGFLSRIRVRLTIELAGARVFASWRPRIAVSKPTGYPCFQACFRRAVSALCSYVGQFGTSLARLFVAVPGVMRTCSQHPPKKALLRLGPRPLLNLTGGFLTPGNALPWPRPRAGLVVRNGPAPKGGPKGLLNANVCYRGAKPAQLRIMIRPRHDGDVTNDGAAVYRWPIRVPWVVVVDELVVLESFFVSADPLGSVFLLYLLAAVLARLKRSLFRAVVPSPETLREVYNIS